MGVVFKGGTSGNRQDAKPPVPGSGSSQPVLDTSTSGATPGTVNLNAEHFRPHRHGQQATPDFMPTGGRDATGSDLADPTATQGGNPGVFEGGED